VAMKHYLQVTDEHFTKATQKAVQYAAAERSTGSHDKKWDIEKPPENNNLRLGAKRCNSLQTKEMGLTGLELQDVTACNCSRLYDSPKPGDAFSGAVLAASILSDSDLQFLIANWAKLPEGIKSGILAIVNGSID